ncbi:MAG: hypothetical protein WC864_07475 [Ilumatobacteraceae bacterium]
MTMILRALEKHFFELFGVRNSIYLDGINARIDLLSMSVGDLQDVVRKEIGRDAYAIALARIISRFFCIDDHFRGNLRLVVAFSRKYPLSGCSYCHQRPCQCSETRLAFSSIELAGVQAGWTLGDWARHLDSVYGERNRRRGIEYVLNRLFREVEELRGVSRRVPRLTSSATDILNEYALEIADGIAWTAAAANILGVDLEQAVLGRFGDGCTSCRTTPCSCTHFAHEQVDWTALRSVPNISVSRGSEELPRS